MASSSASTVDAYLAELPPERREVVAAVRDVVRRHLPAGYHESMGWGMICYAIPLEVFPDTYNKQPLAYAAIAAQKNHFALYLNCLYGDEGRAERFEREFAKAGKKLDMGKSCVRFKRLDDLALDVIGRTIASTPPEEMIARHRVVFGTEAKEARRAARKSGTATAKTPAAKTATAKTSAAKRSAATKPAAGKPAAKTPAAKRATAKAPATRRAR